MPGFFLGEPNLALDGSPNALCRCAERSEHGNYLFPVTGGFVAESITTYDEN